MADIDGIVTITKRALPSSHSDLSTWSAESHLRDVASTVRLDGGEPFHEVWRLFFRCGETGVKWISQVGTADLLG